MNNFYGQPAYPQHGFVSPQQQYYQQNPYPQGYQQPMPVYPQQNPYLQQQGYAQQQRRSGVYPAWLGQLVGVDVNQIEATLQQTFSGLITHTQAVASNYFGADDTYAGLASPVFQELLDIARKLAISLLLDKSNRPWMKSISAAAEIVLYGEIAVRVGGPNAPDFRMTEVALGASLDGAYRNYTTFKNDPSILSKKLAEVQAAINGAATGQPTYAQPNNLASQMMGRPGVGVSGVHPNAVPQNGYTGVNSTQPNKPQQIVAVGQVVGGSNIGDPDDLAYEVAMQREQDQKNAWALAQQKQHPTQVIDPTVPVYTNYDDMCRKVEELDADLLARYRRGEHLDTDDYVELLESVGYDYSKLDAPVEPEPKPQVSPVQPGNHQHVPVEQPKPQATDDVYQVQPNGGLVKRHQSVLPKAWADALGTTPLNPPEERFTDRPIVGMPSAGYYKTGAAEPADFDDYNTPATDEQYQAGKPEPRASFADDLAQAEEDFANDLANQAAAEEQAYFETLNQDKRSLQDIIADGRARGVDIPEPEMELDYLAIPPVERIRLTRQMKIRRVPTYFKKNSKGTTLLYVSGPVRHAVIEVVEEVEYTKHATHRYHQISKFNEWDSTEGEKRLALEAMRAASKRVISTETFVRYLDEKLEEAESKEEGTFDKLSDVIAEQPLVQIEEEITAASASGDYQYEVLDELVKREVTEARALLDTAMINYTRFNTASVSMDDANANMIKDILDAESAREIIDAIKVFKQNSALPVREIARLVQTFKQRVNTVLTTELGIGWGVDDAFEDLDELYDALVEDGLDEPSAKLYNIYHAAAEYTFTFVEDEDTITVGQMENITLVPFYYSQYPVAKADSVAVLERDSHVELYELLDKLYTDKYRAIYKFVTLDNVVLTFCRELAGEGLFFLINVEE